MLSNNVVQPTHNHWSNTLWADKLLLQAFSSLSSFLSLQWHVLFDELNFLDSYWTSSKFSFSNYFVVFVPGCLFQKWMLLKLAKEIYLTLYIEEYNLSNASFKLIWLVSSLHYIIYITENHYLKYLHLMISFSLSRVVVHSQCTTECSRCKPTNITFIYQCGDMTW